MRRTVIATTVALLWLGHGALAGQVAVGFRYGKGHGTAPYTVGQLEGRVHVAGPLHLTATVEPIGGDWGCSANPLDDLRCDYDGSTFAAGGALLGGDTRNLVGVEASLGAFRRSGRGPGQPYGGAWHPAVGIGILAEVGLVGRFRIQAAMAHRRIIDARYADAFDTHPHYTSFTLGLAFVLGSR